MTRSPSIVDQLLNPVVECFTPEVARRISDLRGTPAVQARIEELADKSTEGLLTPEEGAEYETCVRAMNFIGLLQVKARASLSESFH